MTSATPRKVCEPSAAATRHDRNIAKAVKTASLATRAVSSVMVPVRVIQAARKFRANSRDIKAAAVEAGKAANELQSPRLDIAAYPVLIGRAAICAEAEAGNKRCVGADGGKAAISKIGEASRQGFPAVSDVAVRACDFPPVVAAAESASPA